MSTLDETTSDDGGIHRIYARVPLERIKLVLMLLRYLARVRGTPGPRAVAVANELANDPDWNLADHPVVRRILEAAP